MLETRREPIESVSESCGLPQAARAALCGRGECRHQRALHPAAAGTPALSWRPCLRMSITALYLAIETMLELLF